MLQRLKEVIWTYLLETTQMFLSSMASQLAQGDMTEADAAELSFLQQEPGSGLLTAYLGGSCLPTTGFSDSQVGDLFSVLFWGFCTIMFILNQVQLHILGTRKEILLILQCLSCHWGLGTMRQLKITERKSLTEVNTIMMESKEEAAGRGNQKNTNRL